MMVDLLRKCKKCGKETPKNRQFKVTLTRTDSFNVPKRSGVLICEDCYLELSHGNERFLD